MAINGNYVFRETAANLTRNITLTVASVLTVFISLSIVGATVLIRQGAQNLTRQFESGVEFIVYVEPDASASQLAEVKASLQDNPGITKATYKIERNADVVATLHDAFAAAMNDPLVVDRYGKQGIIIKPMSLAELPVYLRNDKERWAKVAAQAGLKAE